MPSAVTLHSLARALGAEAEDLLPLSYGSTVRELRLEAGLTKKEAAYRAEISPSTLHRIEDGQTHPSAVVIARLARVFGVDQRLLLASAQKGPSGAIGLSATHKKLEEATDFDVRFDPGFSPDEVKYLLTALSNYYRACGGVGFEVQIEFEEAPVREPVHA
jgi:transcriptional regulator with XRE-family HTH domain